MGSLISRVLSEVYISLARQLHIAAATDRNKFFSFSLLHSLLPPLSPDKGAGGKTNS